MWVLGWPILLERIANLAVERRLAKPEWSEEKKIDALLINIIRYPGTEGISVYCCIVKDTVLPVVSICTDEDAESEEDAVPQDLPPKHVAQLVKRQLGYKGGPWWFEYC